MDKPISQRLLINRLRRGIRWAKAEIKEERIILGQKSKSLELEVIVLEELVRGLKSGSLDIYIDEDKADEKQG